MWAVRKTIHAEMNWQDGLHFIIEISIMDASLNQTLTKENRHDIWNEGHTYRNGRVGIRHIRQKLGREGLIRAYLIGNDSVSINDITDPRSVVSVWMKDGLLCELFVLPIIAEE